MRLARPVLAGLLLSTTALAGCGGDSSSSSSGIEALIHKELSGQFDSTLKAVPKAQREKAVKTLDRFISCAADTFGDAGVTTDQLKQIIKLEGGDISKDAQETVLGKKLAAQVAKAGEKNCSPILKELSSIPAGK